MFTTISLNSIERKIFLVISDLLIIFSSLFFILLKAFDVNQQKEYTSFLLAWGILFYIILAYVLDIFNLEKASKTRKILPLSFFVGLLFSQVILLVVIFFINPVLEGIYLALFLVLTPSILGFWRIICSRFFISSPFQKKVIYIHDKANEKNKSERIQLVEGAHKVNGYSVKLALNTYVNEEVFERKTFRRAAKKIDLIILDVTRSDLISKNAQEFISISLGYGIEIQTFFSFYENTYEALLIDLDNSSFYEIVNLKNNTKSFSHKMFSFCVDLFSSLFFGILLLVTIPFVYLINLLANKGPLFYSQKRVGKEGNYFTILKYRSMIVDAESNDIKMAKKNDSRITPFGKVLRKFRIDELPQIISIVRQDMSFIGPRPERRVFVDQLNNITPYYNIRHMIKPGITGWAQVKFKYGENLKDSIKKLEYDLYYIKKSSITLDIRILFKTVTTILFSRGV